MTGVRATVERGVVGCEQGVEGGRIDVTDGVCARAHRGVDG